MLLLGQLVRLHKQSRAQVNRSAVDMAMWGSPVGLGSCAAR